MRLPSLSPDTSAFLIVDPQVDMLSPNGELWDLLGAEVRRLDIVGKLKRLRAAAERSGVTVLYASVAEGPRDAGRAEPVNALQALMAERRVGAIDSGGAFHPDLTPGPATVVLTPRQGPSPVHSDLQVQLRRRGVRTVVVAGMIANLCVESHVRELADTGYATLVVGDAIATTGPEALEATLANFGLLATEVADTARVVERFDAITAAPAA